MSWFPRSYYICQKQLTTTLLSNMMYKKPLKDCMESLVAVILENGQSMGTVWAIASLPFRLPNRISKCSHLDFPQSWTLCSRTSYCLKGWIVQTSFWQMLFWKPRHNKTIKRLQTHEKSFRPWDRRVFGAPLCPYPNICIRAPLFCSEKFP